MRFKLLTTAVAALTALSIPAYSQSAPGTGMQAGVRAGIPQGQLSQEQFNKLQDYAEQSRRLTKDDKAKGKTLADVLAEDKEFVSALTKTLPLNCEVGDAIRAAQGPETINGKTVETTTYEASCANGMGYFLVTQPPEKPYGFSCFAADSTRQADIKAGRKPGTVCSLPANADMRKLAAAILSKAGISCSIKDYRYVGQNAANHTEFVEYACDDGKGYISIAALPGSALPIHIETCSQSAARGLPCKLSDNGVLPVTLKSFRDALAQKNIACTATDKTTRVVGQENFKKRYVVEFQCTEQPKGLVAYIPLTGTPEPFESVDCATAAKRGTTCLLPGNN